MVRLLAGLAAPGVAVAGEAGQAVVPEAAAGRASVTTGDARIDVPTTFYTALPKLLTAVFCDN